MSRRYSAAMTTRLPRASSSSPPYCCSRRLPAPRRSRAQAHVQQGRRADLLRALHHLPSAGRGGADVAAHLQGRAPVGALDRDAGDEGRDAAVACRSGHRPFRQCTAPHRGAEGARLRGGSRPARPKATRRICRDVPSIPTAGGSASPTSSSRCRRTIRFRRPVRCPVRLLRGARELRRGPLGAVMGDAAGQSRGRCTTSLSTCGRQRRPRLRRRRARHVRRAS